MSDFECPYCEKEYDYCDDPMSEGDTQEWTCECGKKFVITCSYHVSYTPEKAECLNTGEHAWADSARCPFIIQKKIKQHCELGCGRTQNRYATPEEIETELAHLEAYPSLKGITLGT